MIPDHFKFTHRAEPGFIYEAIRKMSDTYVVIWESQGGKPSGDTTFPVWTVEEAIRDRDWLLIAENNQQASSLLRKD